jgi:hypothetical protein
MATPYRLPVVNNDDGTWGDILLQWLKQQHFDNGTDDAVNNGGHKTVTIRAGGTAAGSAPLKFASGGPLTSPEAGAMEFDTDTLYFTITTGTTRKKVALYDDSSGATGDLYYRNSSGNFVRLGIGSSGQALVVNSGLPSWGSVASNTFSTASKNTNYTIGSTDTVIFADATSGNVTITLPAANTLAGYRFYIKRTDSTANTVSVTSTSNIDGQASVSLDVQYMSIAVVSNNTTWYII